jgi:3-carboxy-cis,cis-muconate cycloisomerase
LDGLVIHEDKMAANLGITKGQNLSEAVAVALAEKTGRLPAHKTMERASRRAAESGRPLKDVLMEDAEVRKQLSAADLTRLLDPSNYIGSAEKMIGQVLSGKKNRK